MRSAILMVTGAVYALAATGCMDRKPGPVCPVPTEIATSQAQAVAFDGVDLLVVVDNSASMEAEQTVLATGFFTLINSLTKPLTDGSWEHPPVENMRVGFVSTDMGLQWGDDRSVDGAPKVGTCESNDKRGDDGRFLTKRTDVTTLAIKSGEIRCEPKGGQCPMGFTCEGGVCVSPQTSGTVNCPGDPLAVPYATTSDSQLTERVACMAQQGITGCGMEQQLEAAVRGLEREENQSFVVDSHILAVLVVSDEEDCSIADNRLFQTEEWLSGSNGYLNVACNVNDVNSSYLFDTARYKERLIAEKNNLEQGVVFAAIVGVPNGDNTCQGSGTELLANNCLRHPDMTLEVTDVLTKDSLGNDKWIKHFDAACDRYDGDQLITSAIPGRRFVDVATDFGSNGYVYSICNEDWSPAMKKIAEIIAEQMAPTCYPKQLQWELLTPDERQKRGACHNCGQASCDVVATKVIHDPDEMANPTCPAEFYASLDKETEAAYVDRAYTEDVKRGGVLLSKTIHCSLPKIPTPLDCQAALDEVTSRHRDDVGWYYCETRGPEDFDDACLDGIDNDEDGALDCEDPKCRGCQVCGGKGDDCRRGCRFGVELSPAAREIVKGYAIQVECLQRFNFEDENCQEDSPRACNDQQDNDGNGLIDCDDTLADYQAGLSVDGAPHMPDPNCCPMTVENGRCIPDMPVLEQNCGASPKNADRPEPFWTDPENAREIDACAAKKNLLGCSW